MSLSVPITPDVEAKLRQRAAEFGRDVAQYAADLIRQGVTSPTFDELLESTRDDFARSGMTPDEIDAFGRALIEKVRGQGGAAAR